ncbi:MAG: RDD family protein [Weeksellaceae bacterium]|jgi:uncharacterized RDD family membrane protein YckC|nr:RDD family protein [Weeksellaceae bacterium]
MSTITIKTPFNVSVSALQAGILRRILAFLLDIVFIGLYLTLSIYIFYELIRSGWFFPEESTFASIFELSSFLQILFTILIFPAFFYSLWTEYFFNGQTFGKKICGIRVVKLNGYRAGFSEYFSRWAFRLVDFWTGIFLLLFFIPLFGLEIATALAFVLLFGSGAIAFFSIIQSKNAQRIGDKIAGTTVLKLKEKHSISITILKEIQEDYIPVYPQVIKLTDNDARIIKDAFTAAKKRGDRKTLERLRKKLELILDIQSTQNDADFIDIIMKDFNYYTQKL